jgi:hypothetical protein
VSQLPSRPVFHRTSTLHKLLPQGWTHDNPESLYRHLHGQHHGLFRECGLKWEIEKEASALAYYTAAIAVVERKKVPLLGEAVDRRAIAQVLARFNNGSIHSRMCFICGQVKIDTGAPRSDIEMREGAWFNALSRESLDANLSFSTFKRLYMDDRHSALHEAPELADGTTEWRRILLLGGERPVRVPVICNPEDVVCSAGCTHAANEVCPECRVPVCQQCRITAMHEERYRTEERGVGGWATTPDGAPITTACLFVSAADN